MRVVDHGRHGLTRVLALATVCLIPSFRPVWAASERFVSVLPGDEVRPWVVEAETGAAPSFWVDGERVAVVAEAIDGGRYRAVLDDVPENAGWLATGHSKPVAALPIAAVDAGRAPFNGRVVYHIMVGYFDNGARGNDRSGMRRWVHRRYAGGDLQGILRRVDHIASLGVSDVWLSPIFQSETSHGYDVQDYYRIGDSRAVPGDADASLALFRRLVKALEQQGVGLILDLPLDYGAGSYDRRRGDPNRRRPKSTKAKQEAEKVWESWGSGFRYWNMGDEDTRLFLREVALHWLVEEGVSGYRMDYVRGVDHRFWAELYAELKAARPDSFIFGEAWQDAHGPGTNMGDIAKYYEPVRGVGHQFDSLIEFPMKIVMTDVFARGGDARQLERWLQATAQAYGGHGYPIYFLDSHDMSRFSDWAVDQPRARLQAAVAFMATLRGPMILFYGTETGLSGGKAQPGFTDSGRIPMPWDNLDPAFMARIRDIVEMKRTQPVLQRGSRLPIHADESTVVMARLDESRLAFVGVNLASTDRVVAFTFPAPAQDGFSALLGSAPQADGTGAWRWELPALSTSVAVSARSGERRAAAPN